MARPFWGAGRFVALVSVVSLTILASSCTSPRPTAPRPTSPAAASLRALETGLSPTAVVYLQQELSSFVAAGERVPGPNAFQRAILANPTITFADYETAMEAATSCAESELPGLGVRLVPRSADGRPEQFGLSISYAPGAAASSTGTSSSSATSSTVGVDPFARADQVLDDCLARYAFEVTARWQAEQTLSGSALAAVRPALLRCLIGAGVHISPSASDTAILRLLDTAGALSSLTAAQQHQVGQCEATYGQFVQSLGS